MRRNVVAVDAVHRAPGALRELLRCRALKCVLVDATLRIRVLDERNGLALAVREDELDAHTWIGVPMDGAATGRRGARAAEEHLKDRRRLRVRLVLGVLALDADDIAKSFARPMTRR